MKFHKNYYRKIFFKNFKKWVLWKNLPFSHSIVLKPVEILKKFQKISEKFR